MGGMTTETLTGHDLDAAVARVLGWREFHATRHSGGSGFGSPDGDHHTDSFSAADCSGLAPVLAWLEANGPTKKDAIRLETLHRVYGPVFPEFGYDPARPAWEAHYRIRTDDGVTSLLMELAPTLPAAACRLLVAWAARLADGGSKSVPETVR
jgi:hypothetical protein